jgi:hypothetical protein
VVRVRDAAPRVVEPFDAEPRDLLERIPLGPAREAVHEGKGAEVGTGTVEHGTREKDRHERDDERAERQEPAVAEAEPAALRGGERFEMADAPDRDGASHPPPAEVERHRHRDREERPERARSEEAHRWTARAVSQRRSERPAGSSIEMT